MANVRASGAGAREAGFTLIELLVAGVLGATAVGLAIHVILGTQRSLAQSTDRVERTQNSRTAIQMLMQDLQMAGSGFGGRTVATGGVSGHRLYAVRTESGGQAPDTLEITASLEGGETRTTQVMGSPGDALFVASTVDFSEGDLLVITNGVEADLFQVTGFHAPSGRLDHAALSPYNNPVAHDLWPGGGYAVGARVVEVQRVSYWVGGPSGSERLMRRVNEEQPVPVAGDIQEMMVQYRMADGSQTENPANPALVRSVVVQCLTRPTSRSGSADTLSVRVQPRVL